MNKVLFSTYKSFSFVKSFFLAWNVFPFVIHLHHSWAFASPRKLGQQKPTRGANESLMEKHFTARKNDFTLEKLLPWRKGTFPIFSRLIFLLKMKNEKFIILKQFYNVPFLHGKSFSRVNSFFRAVKCFFSRGPLQALASSGSKGPLEVQMDHSWKNISLLWKLISLW